LRPRDAAMGKHVLGERRHQPKQHHGQQHRPMCLQVLIAIYNLIIHQVTQFPVCLIS